MSKGRQVYQHVGQHLLQCRRDLHIAPSFQWCLTTIRAPGGASVRTFGTTPQTQRPQHPNPGNFANSPKEELKEIGRKGGHRGGRATGVGGFHDMDPDKQREIASKGGRGSSGYFTQGSKSANEAGQKGRRPRKGTASPSSEEYEDIFV